MAQPQREGWLAKRSPSGLKKFQNRFCTLANGAFRYYKDEAAAKAGVLKKGKGEIMLEGAVIQEMKKTGGKPWVFGVTPVGEGRIYTFAASSEGERKQWISDLTEAATYEKQRKAKEAKIAKKLAKAKKWEEEKRRKEKERKEKERKEAKAAQQANGEVDDDVEEPEPEHSHGHGHKDEEDDDHGHSQNSGSWTVYVKLRRGHRLAIADSNGCSDPYVNLQMNDCKKTKKKSKIIKKTLNPDWGDEEFKFENASPSDVLKFFVKDYDGRGRQADPLGNVNFPLSRMLTEGNNCAYTLDLVDVPANESDGIIPDSQIVVHLKLVDTSGVMVFADTSGEGSEVADVKDVTIDDDHDHDEQSQGGSWTVYLNLKSGHNLSVADSNGYSDPYVNLQMNDSKKTKKKSKIIKKTLNPDWGDEEFKFENACSTDVLKFYVKDYDGRGRQADPLGNVNFPLSRILTEGNDCDYTLDLVNVPPNENDGKTPEAKIVIHLKLVDAFGVMVPVDVPNELEVAVRKFVESKSPSKIRSSTSEKPKSKKQKAKGLAGQEEQDAEAGNGAKSGGGCCVIS